MHRAQEPAVGVIEDVTVEDPRAGTLVEPDRQPDRLLEGDIDGVLPLQRAHRLSALVEHEEEEAVQMERV